MPRRDDEFDDDDRPRRRMPRDDFDDDGPPRRPQKSNLGLVLGIIGGILLLCCGGGGGVAYLLYVRAKKAVNEAVQGFNEGMESVQSHQNLQQIGTGIQAYSNANGTLPNDSRESQVKAGGKATNRPLLSWRVHILPYIGYEALYRRFKLDEPWDSPSNRQLLAEMPPIYGTPEANKRAGAGKTFYRGFTHRGAAFEQAPAGAPEFKVRFPAGIVDGLTITVLVVEAGDAVEWTKPDSFDWSAGQPRPQLGGISPKLPYCLVLMADGSVHQLRKDVPDQTLRWLIDRQDGNVIPNNWEYR